MNWFKMLFKRKKKVKRKRSETTRLKTSARNDNHSEEDFGTSAIVAAATDSELLGYAVGGSIVGAIVGASLSGDDCSHGGSDYHGDISVSDSSSYYSGGSSYDGGSSCGGSSD